MDTGSSCLNTIYNQLLHWEALPGRIRGLMPDWISQAFHYDSTIPITAVCLRDCMEKLGGARYALDRYCEVGSLHRAQAQEIHATFFERYYLDDVAFRLYSAAENLADGILFRFEVTDVDLAEFRNTGSQWERCRKYLNKQHPTSTITLAVSALRRSSAWRFTMGYRGRWVHNQPDTVAGLGLMYERKKRWTSGDDGTRRLVIGPGDTPKQTTGGLANIFTQAFADLVPVVDTVISEYELVLEQAGV